MSSLRSSSSTLASVLALSLLAWSGPSTAASAGWTDQATGAIRRGEYRFTLQPDGRWSAPNRAHDLRARIGAGGIEIGSRRGGANDGSGGWSLLLRLTAHGREGSLVPAEQVEPSLEDGRVEFRRSGLTEWYVNDARGLEQGFTLAARPEIDNPDAPLVLEMALAGGLGVYPSEDGQSVTFKTGSGAVVLRYAGLFVRDAAGREVGARLAVLPGRLQIRIQDRDAVYPLEIDPLMTSAAWTAEGDQDGADFGFSVATAGDVNGDGYSDVVIGAYLYDNGETDEGRAFVYLGSASGLPTTPAWTAESNQVGSWFGYSVASAGDVDGDGFGDVIVGSPLYDNGTDNEGRAFVYLGSASGLSATSAWTVETNQFHADVGYSVASAGDVNGDGFGDVIVGAPDYDNGETDEGRAFVYLGSASGLATSPAWTAESDQAGALFGTSVATAGDVNGDGFSDVIVDARLFDNGETDEGRTFVYLGSASGLSATPAWTTESNQTTVVLGMSSAGAGDVNGDGFSDVIVGFRFYANGQSNEGRAYVYLGSASGLSTTPAWTAESDQNTAFFGTSVATAGDVNGDGFSDVIVGADTYDNGQTNEGRAYLYLGSASGLATTPAWTAESDQASARFGVQVATAGDVNGDGFSDVLVGAYTYDNGNTDEGRASVYYGNAGGGLDRAPRQARADGSAPLYLLGRSDSQTAFRLKALGRTPGGRDRVHLQWEVKPLGTALNGTGLQQGSALDSGAPGGAGSAVPLDDEVTGLTPGTPYHWRLRIASASPLFPWSPWLSLPYNGAAETDLRTALCVDTDGDGYGSPGDASCPAGGAADCNDAVAAVYPGATEICDNVDNDCDAVIDGFATACGVGACAAAGTCTAGADSCTPGTPTPELCDTLDNDCDGIVDNAAAPTGTPALTADPSGPDTLLSWGAVAGATRYDVVRGAISTLRSSGGNFTLAVDLCAADDLAAISTTVAGSPSSNTGIFFLARAENCGGMGTYDTGGPSQVGLRDAEINAAAAACP
jgi:hypothetical protein